MMECKECSHTNCYKTHHRIKDVAKQEGCKLFESKTITSKEYQKIVKKPRVSKYKNIKCEYKGMKFDSKKELKRYQELELMEKEGEIRNLEFHPTPYELSPTPNLESIKYQPDYFYEKKMHIADERYGYMDVVEDCKGMKTDVYKLKKKLMHAKYGIIIKES